MPTEEVEGGCCCSTCANVLEDCDWLEVVDRLATIGNLTVTLTGIGIASTTTDCAGCTELGATVEACANETTVIPPFFSYLYNVTFAPGAFESTFPDRSPVTCNHIAWQCTSSCFDYPFAMTRQVNVRVWERMDEIEVAALVTVQAADVFTTGEVKCGGHRLYHKVWPRDDFPCAGPWELDDSGGSVSEADFNAGFPALIYHEYGLQCLSWPATLAVEPTEAAADCSGDTQYVYTDGTCCITGGPDVDIPLGTGDIDPDDPDVVILPGCCEQPGPVRMPRVIPYAVVMPEGACECGSNEDALTFNVALKAWIFTLPLCDTFVTDVFWCDGDDWHFRRYCGGVIIIDKLIGEIPCDEEEPEHFFVYTITVDSACCVGGANAAVHIGGLG